MPSSLVVVWKIASEVAGPGSRRISCAVCATSQSRAGNETKATMPTTTLNSTWATAARLAEEVAPMTANRAVEVVPTFAPITMRPPRSTGSGRCRPP